MFLTNHTPFAAAAAAEFHHFSRLPAELQHQIWTEAILDLPGVVLDADDLLPCDYSTLDLRGSSGSDEEETAYDRIRYCKHRPDRTSSSRPWLPPILEVSADAYRIAKELGLLRNDLFRGRKRTVWFNVSRDALFFTPLHLRNKAWQAADRCHQLVDLNQKVQKIVATAQTWEDGHAFEMAANFGAFPELKSVFVLDDKISIGATGLQVHAPKSGHPTMHDMLFVPSAIYNAAQVPQAQCRVEVIRYAPKPCLDRHNPEYRFLSGAEYHNLRRPKAGSAFDLTWMMCREYFQIRRDYFEIYEQDEIEEDPHVRGYSLCAHARRLYKSYPQIRRVLHSYQDAIDGYSLNVVRVLKSEEQGF